MTTTYSYDIANRLLGMLIQGPSAQIENLLYEYDANGNRTSFTSNASQPSRDAVTGTSYDEANRMLGFTPATGSTKDMTYDENGNLLTSTNGCGTTTYTWDARNRLAGISGFKADCSSLSASFAYDALGRRTGKTINGTTTQFVYDGLDIIQEKQNGAVTANYVRTLNIDEPLARVKSDGTERYYVADALGSIIALVDATGVGENDVYL
jgi:YD repeat-containing protein